MAAWKVHNRWTRKFTSSISEKDLNLVNRLIDFPEEMDEFLEFLLKRRTGSPNGRKGFPIFLSMRTI